MKHGLRFIAALLMLAGCSNKQEFDATGTFEATEVTVSAETSGKVLTLNLEEGQTVKAGECLGIIDTMQLYLQRGQLVQQQQALLRGKPNAGKQVSSLRQQIEKQEREVARVERLLDGDVATQKNLDDAQTHLNVLRNQLDATLSTLNTSNASIDGNAAAMEWQIKQLDNSLLHSRIASPIDGTVLVKYVGQGEMAVAGMPIMKVADLDNLFLRAYFTSDQLSKVKVGQKVTVIADFGGDEQYEYEGTICWISEESEFTPKSIQTRNSRANLVYATKIAVKNDGKLKIGLYGEVKL
ncbi:MAG: HlyD family efflux transporter periplasmic adaptor subunit [Bacteroidales bacterium]|nr:HlyD family efflux transporter periplasmic adaptor subunit [Bacteroidales bacterium]